jgi:MFS family permease
MAITGAPRIQVRPNLVLVATILASSLDFVDGSVINVGLPAIERSLHGSPAGLQWLVNAYLLPLSALLLLGGALGDRFGRRRLLALGIGLFAVGSAACALAPSLTWLILARSVQGVAAAMMLPNSLAVLGGAFEGGARSRAVGLWAASAAVAGAIGPVLGGWLIDTVGWRAIFLINLPLAAAAIGITLYGVERDPKPTGGARLDVAGAVLVTAALAALTWGLTEGSGSRGWTASAILALVAGALLAAGFGWNEVKLGDRAMMPVALFGSCDLVALNLLTLLLYGALAGFLLLLPYLLITHLGYSATAAGAALLPLPLVMALASPPMGDLAGRIGPRGPLVAGATLVARGLRPGDPGAGGRRLLDRSPAGGERRRPGHGLRRRAAHGRRTRRRGLTPYRGRLGPKQRRRPIGRRGGYRRDRPGPGEPWRRLCPRFRRRGHRRGRGCAGRRGHRRDPIQGASARQQGFESVGGHGGDQGAAAGDQKEPAEPP